MNSEQCSITVQLQNCQTLSNRQFHRVEYTQQTHCFHAIFIIYMTDLTQRDCTISSLFAVGIDSSTHEWTVTVFGQFCFHRQMLVQRPRGKGVLKTRVHNTKLQLSRQDCVTINPSLLYQVLPALHQMAMYQSLYTAPIWRLVHHRFTIQLAVGISACTEELTRISNESKKETHVSYWHAFEVVVSTWQLFKSITIPQSSTNDKIYQFLSQNLNHFQKCESVSLTQY